MFRCACGDTTFTVFPVRISRPPAITGISICSEPMSESADFSVSRSAVPGA